MHVADLPERTQEYLKLLWHLSERSGGGRPVSLTDLSQRARQKNSTTSEAIKRLHAKGLVEHTPYSGISLSELGAQMAVEMVRRHRLIESFLVETLGYTWDEIHEDADLLEHAASDRFIERIDALLGYPNRDPHGDPIPNANGVVEELATVSLADYCHGTSSSSDGRTTVVVEQVNDDDPELLRYLSAHDIALGTTLIIDGPSVAGLLSVRVLSKSHRRNSDAEYGQPVALALSAAADIKVCPHKD